MDVSPATIRDYPEITNLLIEFANQTPFTDLHNPQPQTRRVMNTIHEVQKSGCVFVAKQHDQVIGILLARIVPDIWLPEVRILRELAWYVSQSHRKTRAGYLLYKKYKEFGEELMSRKVINAMDIGMLSNSPDVKLHKRGWQPMETHYVLLGDL